MFPAEEPGHSNKHLSWCNHRHGDCPGCRWLVQGVWHLLRCAFPQEENFHFHSAECMKCTDRTTSCKHNSLQAPVLPTYRMCMLLDNVLQCDAPRVLQDVPVPVPKTVPNTVTVCSRTPTVPSAMHEHARGAGTAWGACTDSACAARLKMPKKPTGGCAARRGFVQPHAVPAQQAVHGAARHGGGLQRGAGLAARDALRRPHRRHQAAARRRPGLHPRVPAEVRSAPLIPETPKFGNSDPSKP